jgi:aryl-alcohol dehydrogenase-like predicted oxidoreductase/NAD-dependent dihydropyrimidine dehydrogenase PreA subunit
MNRVPLGRSGLSVHPLVFGTLPMGPLQANLSPQAGGRLIRHALEAGVTLLDTAELYGSYAHIRAALDGYRGEVAIATKTHALDPATARLHVEKALRELAREQLEIVHLHAARLPDPFNERADVLELLLKMQKEGKIGLVGMSSHYVSAIRKALDHPEIAVLHPLINRVGRGILDGTASDMAAAIAAAAQAGKGIYAMKALAGGNLISSAREALAYVRNLPGVHAVALGMLSNREIDANLAFFEGRTVDPECWQQLESRRRQLRIMSQFCKGCGSCATACTEGGLHMIDGKAVVDVDACVLCGYCAAACPEFIIRVV